ncbi:hypothetical protein QE152_g39002 [Popillia japonica]|uniref:RNase H type-1 domain-containing protein n=1 Tax=Popillia japonica TaxID=7064 RepID=A0AAW1HVS1_POPJA
MSSAKNNSNSITSVEGGNTENVKGLGTVISNKTQSFASIVKDNAMSNFKFPERDQAIVFDTIDDTQKNDYIIGVDDTNFKKFPERDQAIVFDTIDDTQKNDYIIGVGELIGPKHIIFASRIANNRICIYFSSKEIVDKFLDNHKGITLQDKFINARRLVSTAKRVILSNVSPCIPHNIVEEHLKRVGLDVVSAITFVTAGLNKPDGSPTRITRPDQSLSAIDISFCVFLNSGSPTRITRPDQSLSAIDISLCSPDIAQKIDWQIMDDTFTSDHFPIIMTIQYGFAPTDLIYPKRRWNIQLFPKYTSYLESLYDSPRETSSAEEKVEYCVTCIRKAADAIFRINQPFSPNKRYVPPWWDVECTNIIEKRKQILKEYKKNRTLSNYLRVRETLAYSKRFLKKKKKDSWRTFCSGLSSNTPIAEVWNTLKKLNRTNVSYTKMEDDLANLFLRVNEHDRKLFLSISHKLSGALVIFTDGSKKGAECGCSFYARDIGHSHVVVMTDSASVMLACRKREHPAKMHPIILHVISLLIELRSRAVVTEIYWVKSHSNIVDSPADLNHIFFGCQQHINTINNFIELLILESVPLPTSIITLLVTNNKKIYDLIIDTLYNLNIRVLTTKRYMIL